MMANVSTAGALSRVGRISGNNCRTQTWYSIRLASTQPETCSTRRNALPSSKYSFCKVCKASAISASLTLAKAASGSSSKYSAADARAAAISFSESGFCDAKSRDSTTAFRVTMCSNPSSSIDHAADLDFGEQTSLKDPNLAHPNEFQQSQKRHSDLGPTRRRREKIKKGNWMMTLNRPHDKVN